MSRRTYQFNHGADAREIKCAQCGYDITQTDEYSRECGGVQARIYCENCSQEAAPGLNCCTDCGQDIVARYDKQNQDIVKLSEQVAGLKKQLFRERRKHKVECKELKVRLDAVNDIDSRIVEESKKISSLEKIIAGVTKEDRRLEGDLSQDQDQDQDIGIGIGIPSFGMYGLTKEQEDILSFCLKHRDNNNRIDILILKIRYGVLGWFDFTKKMSRQRMCENLSRIEKQTHCIHGQRLLWGKVYDGNHKIIITHGGVQLAMKLGYM